MPKGRVENLKLIKTTEEAREKGRAGGITPVDAVENVTKQIRKYYDEKVSHE